MYVAGEGRKLFLSTLDCLILKLPKFISRVSTDATNPGYCGEAVTFKPRNLCGRYQTSWAFPKSINRGSTWGEMNLDRFYSCLKFRFFFSHLRSKDERKESAKKRTADIRPAHLALNLSLRFFWITVFDVRSSKIPTSPPLICRLSCFYPGHSCSVVIRQRPPGICLITVWRYVCQQVAPPPLLQPSFSWSAVSFDGCDPAGSRKEVSVWKWKAVSATLRICCDGEDDCNSLRDFFQGIHQLRCRWYGLYQSEMKDVSDILSTLLPPLPHWPGSQRQVMMYSSGD